MKNQKGFIYLDNFTIVVFLVVVGFIGWAAITFLIWLFSHITLGIK